MFDLEERISIATVGLCRAALVFDESRGWKFTTVAWTIIQRLLIDEYRKMDLRRSVSRQHVSQFDDQIDQSDPLSVIEARDWWLSVKDSVSDSDQELLREYYSDDLTLRQMAKKHGCTFQNIDCLLRRIRKALRKA